MVTFLELPRELRDKILSLVLSHHEEAPQDVSDPSGRAEFDDTPFRGFRRGCIKYIEDMPMRDCTSLLLLNHQLHSETQDLIRLLPTKSHVIDVIIAKETKLWATWLYAPVLSTRVDRVYAAIRTIGYYKNGHSLFRGGDGGPPQLTMSLYALIERGVSVGPVGRRTMQDDKKIGIKELVIDIRSPDVPASKILPREHCAHRRKTQYRKEHGPEFLLHPDYIVDYVARDIRMLIGMSYYTASYGALLYEELEVSKS